MDKVGMKFPFSDFSINISTESYTTIHARVLKPMTDYQFCDTHNISFTWLFQVLQPQ